MENSESSISLKLLIDAKGNKVLFAEAGKDFVDFLFTLLSLPVGTVTRLLSKTGMVGSLGQLYASVEKMNETYLQPNLSKDILLKPNSSVAGPNVLQLTNNVVDSSDDKVFYVCSRSGTSQYPYVAKDSGTPCNSCGYSYDGHSMSTKVTLIDQPKTTVATSSASGTGYVKGVVTYMIMDDLEVKPMSTISSITLLNRFNIKDVGSLDEKVVELGMDEAVKLLKESLQSKSVLTNVFLGKKTSA